VSDLLISTVEPSHVVDEVEVSRPTDSGSGASRLVTVIVVSFNSVEHLSDCLEPLRNQSSLRIIVVDNASTDGSVEVALNGLCDLILCNHANVGFARAVNSALPRVDTPYVLLLNPDARITPSAVDALVQAAQNDSQIAAIAPRQIHPHGRTKTLAAGWEPTIPHLLMHYSGLSRLSRRRPSLRGLYLLSGVHDLHRTDVDWVSGGCVLIRSSDITRVGGLPERWFMYAEDVALCSRLRRSGQRVVHEPLVEVVHEIGTGSARRTRTEDIALRRRWVAALKDYYTCEFEPHSLTLVLWGVVLAGGLLSRSFAYNIRYVSTWNPVWRDEAWRFRRYARTALAPVKFRDLGAAPSTDSQDDDLANHRGSL
jgi:N-acetylglucosaminyl-diphospho-decaprenol L-rhamnosyltransferase